MKQLQLFLVGMAVRFRMVKHIDAGPAMRIGENRTKVHLIRVSSGLMPDGSLSKTFTESLLI